MFSAAFVGTDARTREYLDRCDALRAAALDGNASLASVARYAVALVPVCIAVGDFDVGLDDSAIRAVGVRQPPLFCGACTGPMDVGADAQDAALDGAQPAPGMTVAALRASLRGARTAARSAASTGVAPTLAGSHVPVCGVASLPPEWLVYGVVCERVVDEELMVLCTALELCVHAGLAQWRALTARFGGLTHAPPVAPVTPDACADLRRITLGLVGIARLLVQTDVDREAVAVYTNLSTSLQLKELLLLLMAFADELTVAVSHMSVLYTGCRVVLALDSTQGIDVASGVRDNGGFDAQEVIASIGALRECWLRGAWVAIQMQPQGDVPGAYGAVYDALGRWVDSVRYAHFRAAAVHFASYRQWMECLWCSACALQVAPSVHVARVATDPPEWAQFYVGNTGAVTDVEARVPWVPDGLMREEYTTDDMVSYATSTLSAMLAYGYCGSVTLDGMSNAYNWFMPGVYAALFRREVPVAPVDDLITACDDTSSIASCAYNTAPLALAVVSQ